MADCILQIEKIRPSITPSLRGKTEGPLKMTLPINTHGQETRHSVSPRVPKQNIKPTTHNKLTETTSKQV